MAMTHRRARRAARYDALVPAVVLTVIGDDRVGLVEALADTVSSHGGNWEHSQMAELAGKFAGIVVVTVPADRATDLTGALRAPTACSRSPPTPARMPPPISGAGRSSRST